MPHYFFDSVDPLATVRDEIGTELTDDGAALDEATYALSDMAKDQIRGAPQNTSISMSVRNDRGATLFVLNLELTIRRP